MKVLLTAIIIVLSGITSSSIYIKKFTTLQGMEISLAQYQGKKILLVNIASASKYAAAQLPELEHLYKKYKDSLEVLAFPSNDFGNEPKINQDLQLLLQNTYHISFPVSVLMNVTDNNTSIHPLYQWLQRSTENGSSDVKVKKDFQKYLLAKDGTLLGIFSAATSPLDEAIVKAITSN